MSRHNDRPTLRQLEYLIAVAEEKSFSRAADRCHVSQPTLSSQVRQLEIRIGRDVFERTSRGVITTPVGEELIEHARQSLAAADRLLDVASVDPKPLTGRIKLGSVSTITPYLVPEVVAELEAAYPTLQIELHDDVGDRLKQKLVAGELDAILTPLPTGLAGCHELELAKDPFVVVAPAATELGACAEPVSLDVLADSKLLLLDDPHCIRGHALEICMQANCSPYTAFHATSISALVQLVRHGLGATLLPTLVLDLELGWLKDLRIKRFADPVPTRTLGLVWRNDSPRTADFGLLGACLMRHALAKPGLYASVPDSQTFSA